MKKIYYTLILAFSIAGLFFCFSFFDKSENLNKYHSDGNEIFEFNTNPPGGRTGAPGEGNCTDCHLGSTQSAAGTVTYTYSDLANEYLPGQSYDIDISVADGAKNGFELTVLDAFGNGAGTFTTGTHTSTVTFSSKKYIRHSSSVGVTDWSFTWNAPTEDKGNLTVYYAVNKSNSSDDEFGDAIYLGQETINIAADASLTHHQQLDEAFEVFVDNSTSVLNLSYKTLTASKVNLNILDISGKLIYREFLGIQSAGNQKHQIDVSQFNQSGIYFVSLLIDNEVVNKKVWLN